MKITGWRSLKTVHRWQRPIGDVNGAVMSGVTEVPILLLETDEGLTGIGLGNHTDIARVFPAIEGEDPNSVNALYDRMQAWVFKSSHAGSIFGTIGVVDMALWDLKAKMVHQPLWKLLGARDAFVPGYASGLDYPLSDEQLITLHQSYAEQGFTGFKLKGGLDPEVDLQRLLTIRAVYQCNSKSPAVMIDVNESMNTKQAVRYVKILESKLDLTWIEEPVRRWDAEGHAHIRSRVNCAVASGENLTGLEQYMPLFRQQSVDIVQAGMCWGISHFLRVSTVAHAHSLPASPVGYNANPVAHAAAAIPNHLGCEVQDLNFPEGLIVDQQIIRGGIELGQSPGLGITVDEARIVDTLNSTWSTPKGPHVRSPRTGLRLAPDDFNSSHSTQ